MGSFWDKLEQYLFDVFGLLLPGLTAGLVFLYLSVWTFGDVAKRLHEITLFRGADVLIVLMAAYFLGHVLKTLADCLYRGKVSKITKRFFSLKRKKDDVGLLGKDYQPLIEVICQRLQSETGIPISREAFEKTVPHPLFKLSDYLAKNNLIKNLKDLHHAKYNAYKSLSFVFLMAFMVCLIEWLIPIPGFHNANLLVGTVASLVFFGVFYSEYKTYHRWCALESINILFYYFGVMRKQPETTL